MFGVWVEPLRPLAPTKVPAKLIGHVEDDIGAAHRRGGGLGG